MKILHTADWHLGKKLNGVSRLFEQEQIISEIADLAESEGVDVVIAAGDIFDSSFPSAEAEELFYRSCLSLGRGRIFIALAGNHDDPDRLSAPSGLAKALNVFLVGGYDNSVYTRKNIRGGEGYISIEKGGEVLNLALMPYPQHSRLSDSGNRDKSYCRIVGEKLEKICGCFNENEYNVLASHLFMTKSGTSESLELTDERELGTASVLPSSILPKADYTALGHIHKPFAVSNSANVFYSGSILSYSYDDIGEKSVVIAEFKTQEGKKKTQIRRVALRSGRRLMRAKADAFLKAMQILSENPDAFVELEYCGTEPLKLSEVNELKKQPSFNKLVNNYYEKGAVKEYKQRTDEELFNDFYSYKNGEKSKPSKELTEMFLKVMSGEEDV